MLRAKFNSPRGLFGSSIFPQSAPSRMISRAQYDQLAVNHFEWRFDFAFNSQPPFVPVDLRDGKMCPDVKRFCRRNKTVEVLKRHLEIQRILASHDPSVAEQSGLVSHNSSSTETKESATPGRSIIPRPKEMRRLGVVHRR